MDAVASIILVIFIATLIAVAVVFGFALLAFILSVALVTALLVVVREKWYRWRFISRARSMEAENPTVIEVEYQDITQKDDERR